MSSAIVAAQRRRNCLLATTFLGPILSLGISAAEAQQSASNPLPAIEISSPEDQTRTRAKPITDEGSGSRRVAPKISQTTNTNIAPASGSNGSPATGAPAIRQFNGIVGASATVITSEDIARAPAQTVQEIIAQTPGVQLKSLYGGVNGAGTAVDLRGFGAF